MSSHTADNFNSDVFNKNSGHILHVTPFSRCLYVTIITIQKYSKMQQLENIRKKKSMAGLSKKTFLE